LRCCRLATATRKNAPRKRSNSSFWSSGIDCAWRPRARCNDLSIHPIGQLTDFVLSDMGRNLTVLGSRGYKNSHALLDPTNRGKCTKGSKALLVLCLFVPLIVPFCG